MVSLKVTPEKALQLLSQIPHGNCQDAIEKRWVVDHDNFVKGQSVLWLFCWAKTGQNCEAARLVACGVFNEILNHDCFGGKTTFFEWFDSRVDHDYARNNRYSPPKRMEEDLENLLCTKP